MRVPAGCLPEAAADALTIHNTLPPAWASGALRDLRDRRESTGAEQGLDRAGPGGCGVTIGRKALSFCTPELCAPLGKCDGAPRTHHEGRAGLAGCLDVQCQRDGRWAAATRIARMACSGGSSRVAACEPQQETG